MKKLSFSSLLFISAFLLSCEELLLDTDLNPVYFVECDIDGTRFRSQTNINAYMIWTISGQEEYSVTGQDSPSDFQVTLTLFKSLGENIIPTGTIVETYLTNIAYFNDGKVYVATESGGGGTVTVEKLTDEEVEGTFEGIVVDVKNGANFKEITNGKFKVKRL